MNLKQKTDLKKRRGYYNTPGIFIKYNYGNGIVEIDDKQIELPIYYILKI